MISILCYLNTTSSLTVYLQTTFNFKLYFPKDEHYQTVCNAIVDTLKEKTALVDQWIAVHDSIFGQTHDIPSADVVHLSKMKDDVVTTDTCNAACLMSDLIGNEVALELSMKIIATNSEANNVANFYSQDCCDHRQHVWIGPLTEHLSSCLIETLVEELNAIDFRYYVSNK